MALYIIKTLISNVLSWYNKTDSMYYYTMKQLQN